MLLDQILIEAAGWGGALLILSAYVLVSLGRIEARSTLFQWLNVIGAAGFILNSGSKGAWPSVALNIVWVGIGIYALIKLQAASKS